MGYGWNSKYNHWERVGSDKVSVAIPTIDYPHYELHGGSNFYVKGWQDVDGTKLWFWWEVPNTTKQPHALWFLSGEGEFNMTLYEGCTIATSGTAITVLNSNRNSSTTSSVRAFAGTTVSNSGTAVWSGVFGASQKLGGERSSGYEFIGKTNTNYLFEIVKVAVGTTWLDYDFNWYEHADEGDYKV